jgi:hypothetical protein
VIPVLTHNTNPGRSRLVPAAVRAFDVREIRRYQVSVRSDLPPERSQLELSATSAGGPNGHCFGTFSSLICDFDVPNGMLKKVHRFEE